MNKRQLWAIAVLLCVMLGLYLVALLTETPVYACGEKDRNPPEIQLLCKKLTRGQWWAQ